jgi:CRISPR-associated exonuclease Cas4
VPVEFKRGKPKQNACDAIQLCAQAFCIEEMLSTVVSKGVIYYGTQKRRMTVEFDSALRTSTEETTEQVHALLASGKTPEPVNDSRCRNCSLLRVCLPQQVNKNTSDYIEKKVFDV